LFPSVRTNEALSSVLIRFLRFLRYIPMKRSLPCSERSLPGPLPCLLQLPLPPPPPCTGEQPQASASALAPAHSVLSRRLSASRGCRFSSPDVAVSVVAFLLHRCRLSFYLSNTSSPDVACLYFFSRCRLSFYLSNARWRRLPITTPHVGHRASEPPSMTKQG
jgi:hypothetical protein